MCMLTVLTVQAGLFALLGMELHGVGAHIYPLRNKESGSAGMVTRGVVGAAGGCAGAGNGGCAPPQGAKWDNWGMASSTYAYCYAGKGVPSTTFHIVMRWFLTHIA